MSGVEVCPSCVRGGSAIAQRVWRDWEASGVMRSEDNEAKAVPAGRTSFEHAVPEGPANNQVVAVRIPGKLIERGSVARARA